VVSPTLPALLHDLVARFAPREALISARRRVSYATLAEEAGAVARALAGRGVGKGTRVGLLMPNWPEWLSVAFGTWQCGGVLVPLSTLYRPRELAHALVHADVQLLIAVRRFLRHDYAAALEAIAPGVVAADPPIFHPALPALREVVWLECAALGSLVATGEGMSAEWPGLLGAQVVPTDPATIVFTSGSTAEPKGVVHEHRALCRAAEDVANVLGIVAEDRTWGYLPFFFTGGLVAVALATLARGAGIVLQDVFEPGETLRLLGAERVTVFFAWPHQAEALIAHPEFAAARLCLQKGVGANTKWAASLYPPDHHAVGTFGMTETGPLCTAWPWDAPLALRAASHGPPVGGKEVRICEPESGAVLPVRGEGEICIRGPTLFSHYYRQPPGECFDADGFFHTGDLGWLDERGALHFVGRLKDVIKTAGVSVAAAEVEAVLLEHPAVAAAYAVGVPDASRGENVVAFVVLSAVATAEDLLEHCRARLASYKVPRQLWLRRDGELPLKGSGKVDKTRLREEAVGLAAGLRGAGTRP
jgi:fatty-acyl-CoA synthase